MKKITFIILSLIILNCTYQKILTSDNSFEVGQSICQNWVGGKEASGSGTTLIIPVQLSGTPSIAFKEIFFRGKQVPATLFSEKESYFIKAEIISNTKNSEETSYWNLEPTEAILSYVENEKLKYTKINNIKEKQPLLYNSRPKN